MDVVSVLAKKMCSSQISCGIWKATEIGEGRASCGQVITIRKQKWINIVQRKDELCLFERSVKTDFCFNFLKRAGVQDY